MERARRKSNKVIGATARSMLAGRPSKPLTVSPSPAQYRRQWPSPQPISSIDLMANRSIRYSHNAE